MKLLSEDGDFWKAMTTEIELEDEVNGLNTYIEK